MTCFIDSGSDGTGQITPSIVTSRTSGVAPLGVFFDASATTGTAATTPFFDLAYCWEFGDPTSGVWGTNGRSRNEHKGPVAAHVFETPGTYEVTLRIRDSLGRVVEDSVTITVTDPSAVFSGTNTICFSTSGNFTGAPAGATQVTISTLTDVQPYIAAGKRLLLRSGDTFPAGSGATFNVSGPGHFGSFGSGALPVIDATGFSSVQILQVATDDDNLEDWRFVDLDCSSDATNSRFFAAEGSADDITVLRCKCRGASAAVVSYTTLDFYNNNGSPGHTMYTGWFFHDCDFGQVVGGAGRLVLGVSGINYSIQGCLLDDSTAGEHVLRIFYFDTCVIANNELSKAPVFRLVIKMHDANYSGINGPGLTVGKPTQKVQTSDNSFDASTGDQDWIVAMGPQNSTFDERLSLLLIERNFFSGNADTQACLALFSVSGAAIRENIFRVTANTACSLVGRGGDTQQPTIGLSFRNNTTYGTAGSYAVMQLTGTDGWQDVDLRNCLVAGSGGLPLADAETVLSSNVATSSPGFVAGTPSVPADFRLLSSSPAVGQSDVTYQTAWDYFLEPMTFGSGQSGAAGAAQLLNPVAPVNRILPLRRINQLFWMGG
jgi:hypothetical protein